MCARSHLIGRGDLKLAARAAELAGIRLSFIARSAAGRSVFC
jgi:hypothetical protein